MAKGGANAGRERPSGQQGQDCQILENLGGVKSKGKRLGVWPSGNMLASCCRDPGFLLGKKSKDVMILQTTGCLVSPKGTMVGED